MLVLVYMLGLRMHTLSINTISMITVSLAAETSRTTKTSITLDMIRDIRITSSSKSCHR